MDQQQSSPESPQPAPKSGSSLAGKLLIAGFMGGVVAIECVLAYVFIPSAEDVAVLAEQRISKKLPANLGGDELAGTDSETSATVEIELGEYSISVVQPNSTTSLRVDFLLIGTVLESDQREFRSLFDRHVHRFRDQILFEIRNSEPADLADPGLGLIKRRILEKSNDLFGKPILRSVLFSQFSYMEQ